nr:Mrp/NBP35 family ATP-binding protein [Candidatus Omnitrophota bacterium]
MTPTQKITREKILELLERVEEPVLQESIVSLGLVREIEVEGDQVFIHMEVPGEDLRLQDEIRGAILAELQSLGASRVQVHFSAKSSEKHRDTEALPIPGVRHVVAVASGKGGVGKSTVAVNLALALQGKGARVGLLDGDIYGPNIPIMLGIAPDRKPQGMSEGKISPLEAHGLKTISIGFFANPEQPLIWRGPLLHKTVEQFLHRVDWGQ